MESSAAAASAVNGDYAVDVQMSRPEKSSRLLLIFRGFLMIPHFIFAIVVFIPAAVLILVNYLVVLITGRAAFSGFLSGVLRYSVRLQAYSWFLTDAYPPFSLGEAPDYPVHVRIDPPGHIHRWRVLSYLLAFPHIIALYVLLIVAAIAAAIAWFVVLIFGRYPAGLFGITSAAVRYQARVNAYIYLIVSNYPPFSVQ